MLFGNGMTSFHILLIIGAALAVVASAAALIVDGLRISRETRAMSRETDIDVPAAPISAARLSFGVSRPIGMRRTIVQPVAALEEAPVQAQPETSVPEPVVPESAAQTPATRPQALSKALVLDDLSEDVPVEAPETLHTPLEPFPEHPDAGPSEGEA